MFFTICGSTAVETAIKIAVAYHRAKGDAQRFRFVGTRTWLSRDEHWMCFSW
jgi:adenosylmethionine-8-amino-7-oxononanoate aminotransferase